MFRTELTRFKVNVGKKVIVDEWMTILNEHMEETLLTSKNENMFVETIFREQLNGEEFLYWYSIQEEGGITVKDSENWIDKISSNINLFVKLSETTALHLHNSKRLPMVSGSSVIFWVYDFFLKPQRR